MKKFGIFLIAIALAMLVSCASASMNLFDAEKIDMGGYTVTIPKIVEGNVGVKTVSGTITQGETDWAYADISGYYTQLRVRLHWGDTSNSLRLMVYSPDQHTFGYYYDGSDGIIDGNISVNINNGDGIAEGRWYYEIYGYSVTGTQSYTI
ncbi:hypothetical protein [Methanolacinia paynteri]|uniref:hypothetical protein n=1 Tax=Methanolacinia paynteri TaxID=230356 RepID=UPI001FE208EF|nr:hypothetical protein [Methanolacinia paynteri]